MKTGFGFVIGFLIGLKNILLTLVPSDEFYSWSIWNQTFKMIGFECFPKKRLKIAKDIKKSLETKHRKKIEYTKENKYEFLIELIHNKHYYARIYKRNILWCQNCYFWKYSVHCEENLSLHYQERGIIHLLISSACRKYLQASWYWNF